MLAAMNTCKGEKVEAEKFPGKVCGGSERLVFRGWISGDQRVWSNEIFPMTFGLMGSTSRPFV